MSLCKIEGFELACEQVNITRYMQPGLYEIVCLRNNKIYIGETENLISRLGYHAASLKQNRNHCVELQNDWNLYGAKEFEFNILFLGSKWESSQVRLKKENELIDRFSKIGQNNFTLYNSNKVNNFTFNYRKPIKIDGIIYSSVAEAGRQLPLSATTIRRRLRDSKYPNYESLNIIKHGYTAVTVSDIYFLSYKAVVEAGYAKDRAQVSRQVKSKNKKWQDWKLAEK